MTTLYPSGYGHDMLTLDELIDEHGVDMHPEYARRLFAWIESQGGAIGIGDGWRPNPSDTSQASREGKSFHQTQRFGSGIYGFCAVDLVHVDGSNVHRAPYWSEVPVQGGDDAPIWGVHGNVADEPWHMQPIEIDGYQSWCDNGRPDPVTNYPLPTDPINPEVPDMPLTDDEIDRIAARVWNWRVSYDKGQMTKTAALLDWIHNIVRRDLGPAIYDENEDWPNPTRLTRIEQKIDKLND